MTPIAPDSHFERSVGLVRYLLAASVLKAFSLTSVSRRIYRTLGNRLGQQRHAEVSATDIERGIWMRQTLAEIQPPLNERSAILEIGTGWTHFYAIYLRLFFSSRFTLFDVQDNRQLTALRGRFAHLARLLPGFSPGKTEQWQAAQELAEKVSCVPSFDELYQLLGMDYIIELDGRLDRFRADSFDVVLSADVLEHVDRRFLDQTIRSIYRVLKPGGMSVHQIGIDDHLSHYAPNMSPKRYLRYSDRTWKFFFENRVQYFNRVQVPEFEDLFHASGLELVRSQVEKSPDTLMSLVCHAQYGKYDSEALRVTRYFIVHRKPER
jgi:SAM-dependent methyltransferase